MERSTKSEKEKLFGLSTTSDFSFSDLVDISDLQQLMNHLSELAGCGIAILDVDNTFLASAGLQKICTCFHRIHPETKNNCTESDCYIRENLKTENPVAYKCKNGLWDVAYPIFIERKHVANIFFGQFFFDDEAIDIPYFEQQALKYGFDKTEYLNALDEVPVISHKKADTLKNSIATLAGILTKTGYSNLLLKKEKVEELRIANQQIRDSELKFRKLFEQAGVGVAQVESSTGRFIKINKKFADIVGYTISEMLQLTFLDFTHPDDMDASLRYKDKLINEKTTEFSNEKRYIRKDGTIVWVKRTVTTMWENEKGSKHHITIVQDITDAKKSEQNLLESEFKFRKLFELAGVGVAQVDVTTGRFVKINKKFANMLGYSIDEFLQLTFKDITYPGDLNGSLNNQSLLLKKQIGEFSIEKRYVRKDGTMFWAVLTASSMGEIAGGENFQIAIVQDITERKKSEQDLLESELKFRKLFELAGVGVAQVDVTTGKFVKINKKFANMLGYSIDEFLQLTFKDITYPDDLKGSLNNQSLLLKKQIGEFSIEKRYIRKDGTMFWAVLTASSMGEIAGGENFQIAIVQDITERKKSEEDLLESELKFRKLFESAGVGVVQAESFTGRFLKINKKFAEMLGYSIEELLQLTFMDVTHPDDLAKDLSNVNLLLKKEITEFSYEKRYIKKDGTILWVVVTVTGISGATGEIIYNIGISQDITERKKSEWDLLESELKFRKLFESAGVGVAQVGSSSGKFLKVNKKFADMLGYTIDEMLQLAFQRLTHPEDLEGNLHSQNLMLKKQINEFSAEKRYIRKNGSIIWVMITVSSMGEIDGGDEYNILVVQEITERKNVEQELIESEEKFKSIFHESPIALELYNSEGKLLDCNSACLSMFGIDTINEVIGFNLFDDPNLTTQQKEDIRSGKNVQFEIKFDFDLVKKLNLYKTSNSGHRFLNCLVTSFNKADDNEICFLLHVIDITENKKAEQALKEDNDRFHATMDAIDSVVYVADLENHEILFVNKYVKDVFGEITGKKCYAALQGKTAPCDFCTNHLLLDDNGKAKEPYVWEFQNLITKRWYQCHDQAIQWTNGNLVRFEIATDITKNIEYEQVLKENEIKLNELNSTKDKFFSIISHDLKNPFAVLKSSSELLYRYLEKNDLPKSKAKAAMISNASNRGYALLENLLAWSKSQTGGIKFEPQKLNFKGSVANCINEVEDRAGEKNIIIINEIPNDLILEVDENLLSVVFRNLITNAIKFTHSGGTITINAKTDNDVVEVAVIDTGIGIPKEQQYKLFRLDTNFSRVGTANEASTSLGLVLCKEFIEKHKGKIWVESEEDKGSEFRFTLPYIQTENNTTSVS